MWYNGHKEFKELSSAKGEIYMTKGRKTTQEKWVEALTDRRGEAKLKNELTDA